MSPALYHFLHVLGVIVLASAFGAISTGDPAARKSAMMKHGIGLLVLLITGFGSIAKNHFSYTAPWVLVMFVVWLALGALPVLAKRGILPAPAVGKIAMLLAAIAAYCGYFKVPA